jgi:hypothetical protein
MTYPIFGMFRDAKQASREHDEDCEECRELGKQGDQCSEGARLLSKARELYESIQEGPPEREDDEP